MIPLAPVLALLALVAPAPIAGLAAPSTALGEPMAEYRRSQGYAIPETPFYVALNDCDLIGRRAVLKLGNRWTPPAAVVDCEHPSDSTYRARHGLVADVPVGVIEAYTGQPNWAAVEVVLLPELATR